VVECKASKEEMMYKLIIEKLEEKIAPGNISLGGQ
jgi:hypothetical protein